MGCQSLTGTRVPDHLCDFLGRKSHLSGQSLDIFPVPRCGLFHQGIKLLDRNVPPKTRSNRRRPGTRRGGDLHQTRFLLLSNGLLESGKDESTVSRPFGTRGFHSFSWERAFSKEYSGYFRIAEEPLEETGRERRGHPDPERASSSRSPIRERLPRHLSVFLVRGPPRSRYGPGGIKFHRIEIEIQGLEKAGRECKKLHITECLSGVIRSQANSSLE